MYKERIERVLARMKAAGLSQLLVSDPKSVFYLTGVSVEPYERMLAFLVRDDGKHVLFLNRLFNVPETEYEERGFVPNVCFPCAALCDGETGRIALYYGAADSVVSVAFTTAEEIVG